MPKFDRTARLDVSIDFYDCIFYSQITAATATHRYGRGSLSSPKLFYATIRVLHQDDRIHLVQPNIPIGQQVMLTVLGMIERPDVTINRQIPFP